MGFYVVKEMFPGERTLTREEVNTLYKNACKVVKYDMSCCYSLVDSELDHQKFIHIHDNDGSEADLCIGPFIIKWVAGVYEKADTITFLPYLSYTLVPPFDVFVEQLDTWLNKYLHTINIFPVELDEKWSGSVHRNKLSLRRAAL